MSEPTALPRLRPHARRGATYYAELQTLLAEIGYNVKRDVMNIFISEQCLTVRDVCVLALRYEINLKAMFDFLEDERILRCGTYDRVKDGGIRPMAALREVWSEMQEEAR